MPKYSIEVWETRSYTVTVEADDEDAAKEIAMEDYMSLPGTDSFVSVEFRDLETIAPASGALGPAQEDKA